MNFCRCRLRCRVSRLDTHSTLCFLRAVTALQLGWPYGALLWRLITPGWQAWGGFTLSVNKMNLLKLFVFSIPEVLDFPDFTSAVRAHLWSRHAGQDHSLLCVFKESHFPFRLDGASWKRTCHCGVWLCYHWAVQTVGQVLLKEKSRPAS